MNEFIPIIRSISANYFGNEVFAKALAFLEANKVQTSFSKGNFHDSFICSGIVQDTRENFTIKVKFKDYKLESKCKCQDWSAEKHCQHSSALFVYFLLTEEDLASLELPQTTDDKTDSNNFVAPQFIGKMVKSADKLKGATSRNYLSMNYQTTDGKEISFPEPKELGSDKKIVFDLQKINDSGFGSNYEVNFALKSGDEFIHDISLFETRYLFDWKNGDSYNLPQEISDFIKTLSSNQFLTTPFLVTHFARENKQSLMTLNREDYSNNLRTIEPKVVIDINENSRTQWVGISFVDNQNNEISVPDVFKVFCHHSGALSNFKSLIELNRFIESVCDPNFRDENDKNSPIEYTYTHKNREQFSALLSSVLESNEDMISSNIHSQTFKIPESYSPLTLTRTIWNAFGNDAIRNSAVLDAGAIETIKYPISKETLDKNLIHFFNKLNDLGIQLYFQNKKVSRWNRTSKVKRNFDVTNWFEIDITLNKDEHELIKNLDSQTQRIFKDDELILLGEDDKQYFTLLKKYLSEAKGKSIEKEGPQTKVNLKLDRCRLFDIYSLYSNSGFDLLTEEEKEVCQKLLNIDDLPEYSFPSTIDGTPRDYQKTGYQWIRLLQELQLGACLADDMGLGKTFQTISFVESIKTDVERVLIACPVSILINWQKEFERFSTIKPSLYYGSDRNFNPAAKVIITSYGILRKEAETLFSQYSWDILIMDEVQKLKNAKSLSTQAARKLPAKFRVCLTGTPVENDLSEFYNIIDLAVPGIWGGPKDLNFLKKSKDSRALARSIAKPFILRRTKKQVLKDLPDKLEQTIYLPFSSEQKVRYYQALDQIKNRFDNQVTKNQFGQVLKDLLRLRQLCLWQEANNEFQSTKIDYLMDNLDQILQEDHQVLIYSQFTKYLDIIQNRIKQKKWNYSRIDGSYTLNKRQKEIEAFQEGKNKVFLISLKAGGLGLNLTQANYIFLMDPWWNPAVENQAIDRAYRIGQTKNISVYRLIMKDSVEEKVLELQAKKRELFSDLLEGNEESGDFSGKLSLEDFRNILG